MAMVGVVVALVMACGGDVASPEPRVSASPSWGVAFQNKALGVSFRHAPSWHVSRLVTPAQAPTGIGDVEMRASHGVVFDVTRESKGEASFDAQQFVVVTRAVMGQFGMRIVRQSQMRIDGRSFTRLDLAGKGGHAVRLAGIPAGIQFDCPAKAWPAQKPLLESTLASLRFFPLAQASATSGN
jgi:hypothetical protein